MPSLLLRDAQIVPLHVAEQVPSEPVDVLVEGGVVTQVGPSLTRPADVVEVDASGRWLLPGLWDQHVHLGEWALVSQRLQLGFASSPEQVVDAVRRRIGERPDATVIGWGHRSASWGRDVTVSELDAVSGPTPVALISGDGHHAWLNSAALSILGVPARTSVLREAEWFSVYPRLGMLGAVEDTSAKAYRNALLAAAAQGVVGIVDFEFARPVAEWVDRWRDGADVLRIRAATYPEHLDDVIAWGLRTGDPLVEGDGRLTMGPLKIISDGSLNTRTAWCCQPYDDDSLGTSVGQPNVTREELSNYLTRAEAAGLEVATHAIGDAAVAAAVAAFAATGARGSIEHAQLVARDDVQAMARWGLRASVQPAHLIDDRDVTENLWGGRSERAFAFRWMLDAGVNLALGSDAPVAPLDPWLAIDAAVRRSGDSRDAWHPEQSLTVQEAIAASVDGQPAVRVGSRGDLVLLDTDPLLAEGDASHPGLRGLHVALTIVDGEIVHYDM